MRDTHPAHLREPLAGGSHSVRAQGFIHPEDVRRENPTTSEKVLLSANGYSWFAITKAVGFFFFFPLCMWWEIKRMILRRFR